MQDISYIIRKGRFKITFWETYKIFFLLFGLIMIALMLISSIETTRYRNVTIAISIVMILLVGFILLKSLINRLSFDNYLNTSEETSEEIVSEVLNQFSLQLYKKDSYLYYSSYYLQTGFWRLKIKKEIYFVIYENTILLNIRNYDPAIIFNFSDNLSEKIKRLLDKKVNPVLIKR